MRPGVPGQGGGVGRNRVRLGPAPRGPTDTDLKISPTFLLVRAESSKSIPKLGQHRFVVMIDALRRGC